MIVQHLGADGAESQPGEDALGAIMFGMRDGVESATGEAPLKFRDPCAPYFRRKSLPPAIAPQPKAEFDAFAIGKMEKPCVADALLRFPLDDEPLAESVKLLVRHVAFQAVLHSRQILVRSTGNELHHLGIG